MNRRQHAIASIGLLWAAVLAAMIVTARESENEQQTGPDLSRPVFCHVRENDRDD